MCVYCEYKTVEKNRQRDGHFSKLTFNIAGNQRI